MVYLIHNQNELYTVAKLVSILTPNPSCLRYKIKINIGVLYYGVRKKWIK